MDHLPLTYPKVFFVSPVPSCLSLAKSDQLKKKLNKTNGK